MIAYCWATGVIAFGHDVPPGAIEIARGKSAQLRETIAVTALAYDNETALVPGMSEAHTDDERVETLNRYLARISTASNGITVNYRNDPMSQQAVTPTATKPLQQVVSTAATIKRELLARVNQPNAVRDLAQHIADDAARSDIEGYCREVYDGAGRRWFDTSQVAHGFDRTFIDLGLHYLVLRGLVQLDPAQDSRVAFLED